MVVGRANIIVVIIGVMIDGDTLVIADTYNGLVVVGVPRLLVGGNGSGLLLKAELTFPMQDSHFCFQFLDRQRLSVVNAPQIIVSHSSSS